jgi:hypothetical protein
VRSAPDAEPKMNVAVIARGSENTEEFPRVAERLLTK